MATSYPRFHGDASSVFLRYLAQSMVSEGHSVHVLAPGDPQVDGSLVDKGVTVHRFGYFPAKRNRMTYGSGILPNLRASPWLYLQVPFFLVAFILSLFSLVRRERPDVIHAHWIIPTGLIAVLVGYLLKIPVITTAHGGDAFSLRSPILQRLKTFTLKNSTAWTANTQSTATAAKDGNDIPDPIIIPMGVDVELFKSGRRATYRLGLGKHDQVLLFVGRLVEKKGCDILVKAFHQLVDRHQGRVVLWIVGDGDSRRLIEALVRMLGLSSKVRFFGAIPNERLPDIYAGADLFVLPSVEDSKGDTEGQGVVLLEAMASGVTIIASRVGGVEDVIEDGVTGWVVAPSDPVVLSEKIGVCLLLEELNTTVAEHARSRVIFYDWLVISRDFLRLFTQKLN